MASTTSKGEKKLTGWHVLMWICGFFGVMFIANGFFVYYARSTFPGVEVESSYKEGKIYDQKIADAKAQTERGWQVEAELKRRQNEVILVILARDKMGNTLSDLDVYAEVGRPVSEKNDHKLDLDHSGNGLYQANLGALDPGRWRVKIEARQKGEVKFKSVGETMLK